MRKHSEAFMNFRDVFQWMTTAVGATAILALTAVSALAVHGVPGAGDTSLSAAAHPQAIDRVAPVPHVQRLALAAEGEMNSDDGGPSPDIDDQGIDNPPDTDDDYDGEDYYASANGGIVYGPGWYGPGWWYGPDGRFLASGWWYAPAWWFSPGVVWFGGSGPFAHHRVFHDHDRFGFRGRFDRHDRFRDHGRFGGRGHFGMHGEFRGGMGGRR